MRRARLPSQTAISLGFLALLCSTQRDRDARVWLRVCAAHAEDLVLVCTDWDVGFGAYFAQSECRFRAIVNAA